MGSKYLRRRPAVTFARESSRLSRSCWSLALPLLRQVRAGLAFPSCVTAYPRGSSSRVFQLVLTLVKDLRHLLNCVPIAGRRCDAELFLDLPKVADRFHLPTIQTQDESVLDRNDLQQPVVVRGQTERSPSRTGGWPLRS